MIKRKPGQSVDRSRRRVLRDKAGDIIRDRRQARQPGRRHQRVEMPDARIDLGLRLAAGGPRRPPPAGPMPGIDGVVHFPCRSSSGRGVTWCR